MRTRGLALLSTALTALFACSGLLAQGAPASSSAAAAQTGAAPQVAPATPIGQAQPPAGSAVPPGGQQPTRNPDGTYTIRRTARLVILDVVVTDKKGNVVTGLTRDDFHVTELDQPETILNFEEAGAHAVNDEMPPINSTADLDRIAPRAPVNILLLDEFNTRFEDEAFARYSLKKMLERQPERLRTPTMLIAVDLTKFTVLQDYTESKSALLAALDHHFVAYPWQVHNGGWIAERYGIAFGTLTRVAEAVVGHQGHKNMIWIGRGFPPFNFANAPVDAATRVESFVQQCVNELRDARVTLYTVDPAGVMVDPGIYGPTAAFNDPFGGDYQFNKLAKATGGRAFYGRNDVDAEIATGIRDGASFYSLSYRPDSASVDPKKFRRIKITLSRPDLTATTREGYYVQRGPARVDPQNPSRRLAFELSAANNSNMAYDGVPLTLTADPANPDSFTIHVDGRGLVWTPATDTEPRHADVVVVASTFDKKNKELKQISRLIRAPATGEGIPPTGPLKRDLNLKFNLEHDPKAVRARFVVRVSATGRIGTADAPMNQPVTAAQAQ